MGFYIETDSNKHKAMWLVDNAKARIELGPINPTPERIPVCVVDNVLFEAAGICFSVRETEAFARHDERRRTWLTLPREEVVRLCPHVEELLP